MFVMMLVVGMMVVGCDEGNEALEPDTGTGADPESQFTIQWGNNFSQASPLLSTDWHTYEKLDTFFDNGKNGIIGSIPIESLKAKGFTKFSVKLDYSWSSDNKSNIDMSFKFVNKTTGEQFGEISNTNGSFKFGGVYNKFDISKLQSDETIVIDIRHKKKNALGGGNIKINGGRSYTIIFEK